MISRISISIIFIAFIGVILLAPRASISFAQGPTEEPTKRPYVFPTPVYIPPYADDTPAPRSTPSAPLQPGGDTYTVQSGDSPWTIAQKVYGDGTKYKLIMDANGLTDQTRLRVGMVLKIPSLGGTPSPAPTPVPATPTPGSPLIAPTPVPPNVSPTPITIPTIAPTPNPSNTANPGIDILPTAINFVSALLFVASIVTGVLAVMRYARARRLAELAGSKQSLRLKR